MLEQILKDMYIDPVLLSELDQEQKQILFLKMRQEQVRRWRVWQADPEAAKRDLFAPAKPRRSGVRNVNFLVDDDGKPKAAITSQEITIVKHVETAGDTNRASETASEDNDNDEPVFLDIDTKPPPSTTEDTVGRQDSSEEVTQIEHAWQIQLHRSRVHDEQRRSIARIVRESIDESSYCEVDIVKSLPQLKTSHKPQPSAEQTPCRPKKPTCRKDVVKWFRDVERKNGAGVNPVTGKVSRWFHGIISREEAEKQLSSKWGGAFMVRVSDKIWGYVISYRCMDQGSASAAAAVKFKHFLIDAGSTGYRLFGTKDFIHLTLNDLVEYHSEHPLSFANKETLRFAVGQSSTVADYNDLFDGCQPVTPSPSASAYPPPLPGKDTFV